MVSMLEKANKSIDINSESWTNVESPNVLHMQKIKL